MNYLKPLIMIFCIFPCLKYVERRPLTIVISVDGFWFKYLERNLTPRLMKLKYEGASAPYMINVFPTKTFPNHFSIATGQYPEEHHVLDNKIFDPDLKRNLRYSEELFTRSKSTVPIWIVNEKSGGNRYSGVMMWPGSNFKYLGSLPTHLRVYEKNQNHYEIIDEIVQWITNSTHPANLILMYLDFPDFNAHIFSPDSLEVNDDLKKVDETVELLEQKLYEYGVLEYNLIILSDHGVCSVRLADMINLTEILTSDTYDFDGSSPALGIIPRKGYGDEIASRLEDAAYELGTFDFYRREDIPDEWHYKKSYRAPPFLLVAREGYVFNDKFEDFVKYAKFAGKDLNPDTMFGVHGYVPSEESMHPIFIAKGPSFKQKHTVEPFNVVDLFPLVAHLIGADIRCYKHSGNFENVKDLLAQENVHIPPVSRTLYKNSAEHC